MHLVSAESSCRTACVFPSSVPLQTQCLLTLSVLRGDISFIAMVVHLEFNGHPRLRLREPQPCAEPKVMDTAHSATPLDVFQSFQCHAC